MGSMKNLTKVQAQKIREMNISEQNKKIARKIVRWVNNQKNFLYKMHNTNGRICFSRPGYNDPDSFQMDIWLNNDDGMVLGPIYYVKKGFEEDQKFVNEIGKILFGDV